MESDLKRDSSSTRRFLQGMPKAELHMHLEGSIEPQTMMKLAERNGVVLPWRSPEQLQSAYVFKDLQAFLDLYFEGCRVLCEAEDFYEITATYLRNAAVDGVIRAELYLGPQSFTTRGIAIETILEPILAALETVGNECSISAGLSVSIHRHRTEREAFILLDQIEPFRERLLGIGMGGAERGNPPSKFANFFRACRTAGYRTMAHAGEEGPASYVREALDILKVDRIDHGNACLDDLDLVADLARRQVPLTVCPLSNLRLGVVPSLQAHPLKRMLHSGLNVSVHSDDPPYFGGHVTENLAACAAALALTENETVALVRNGLLSAFVPEQQKRRLLDKLEVYLGRTGDDRTSIG